MDKIDQPCQNDQTFVLYKVARGAEGTSTESVLAPSTPWVPSTPRLLLMNQILQMTVERIQRPLGPLITVSLLPDNLSEYKDLFYKATTGFRCHT